jgi:hypothetical protein
MVTSSDYGTEVLAHAGMRATLITVFYWKMWAFKFFHLMMTEWTYSIGTRRTTLSHGPGPRTAEVLLYIRWSYPLSTESLCKAPAPIWFFVVHLLVISFIHGIAVQGTGANMIFTSPSRLYSSYLEDQLYTCKICGQLGIIHVWVKRSSLSAKEIGGKRWRPSNDRLAVQLAAQRQHNT